MKKFPAGLFLIAFAPMLMGAHCSGTVIKNAVVDCSLASVKAAIPSLIPVVVAILNGHSPNWQQELDALEATGADAVACAVEQIAAGNAQVSVDGGVGPEYAVTTKTVVNAKQYLADHGVTAK